MSTVLAYLLGFLVGGLLGMIGGGGLFLLPIFHFLLKQPLAQATAHTTILVGLTSLMGAIPRIRSGEVDWPTVAVLGLPVTAGMLLVRGWLFYALPDDLFQIGGLMVTREILVLSLFTVILLLSFASMNDMIGQNLQSRADMRAQRPALYFSLLFFCGLFVGIIPGLAGAGGGVLIVPLLVVLFGLPMKTVIGTSLTIVACKSIIGFTGDIYNLGPQIDYFFLACFIGVMLAGVVGGTILSREMDARKLKQIFAWFVLGLAIFIPLKMIVFPQATPETIDDQPAAVDAPQ